MLSEKWRYDEPLPQPTLHPSCTVAVNPNISVPKAKVFDLITPALPQRRVRFAYIFYV